MNERRRHRRRRQPTSASPSRRLVRARPRPAAGARARPAGGRAPGRGPGRRRAAGHPLHRLPALHRAQPGRPARARRPAPASSPAPRPPGSPPTPGCGCSATTPSTRRTADGDDTWQRTQAYLPGLAIAGGTDQVLRNILGERVLGLPPEPRADKSRRRSTEAGDELRPRHRPARRRRRRPRSSSPARRPRPRPRAALEGGALEPGHKALAEIGFLGITVAEDAGGGGGSLLDLAVVAEQGGAVLAGPSLVTAARAAVLLADVPELAAALADGSTAFAVVDGTGPSIDAASADVVPRAGGRRPRGRPRRGHRRRADRRHPRPGVGAAHRPPGAGRGRRRAAGRGPGRWRPSSSPPRASAPPTARCSWGSRTPRSGRRSAGRSAPTRPSSTCWSTPGSGSTSCARWCGGRPGPPTTRRTSSRWRRPRPRPTRRAVFEQAAETVIQVHGGIGFTWEHDAHLYWRRAKVDRLLLGDEAEHLDAVARPRGRRRRSAPDRWNLTEMPLRRRGRRRDHHPAPAGPAERLHADHGGRTRRGRGGGRTPTTPSGWSW